MMFSPKRFCLGKSAVSLTAGLILSACGGGEPGGPEFTQVISPTDVSALDEGERLVVDTRSLKGTISFNDVPELDFTRIELICPNNASMPMNEWLEERTDANDPTIQHFELSLVRVYTDKNGCTYKCEFCPDGVWVCVDSCAMSQPRDNWDRYR